MAKRDYYEVLGVAKGATGDEIRKAYRNLARKLHPDVNKATDAAAKFNEVQEAYDVLSDDQKRKNYDQFGHAGAGFGAGAGGPPGAGRPHYSWSNVGGGTGVGADYDVEDIGSMFEAFFGGSRPDMGGMGGMGGGRARASRKARQAPPQQPPIEHTLDITFMTAARGGTEQLRIEQEGRTRTIEVKIPKGTADGARLRVRGGSDGQDVILRIRVGGHPIFRRSESGGPQGLNLFLDLPLTIAEATLGTEVSVPTLDGSVHLRVPPGTASGLKLRARSQGLEGPKGEKGDLYAVVKIVPPKGDALSAEEADVLRHISERGASPRAAWGA
jgi:curved DNA-binding protein